MTSSDYGGDLIAAGLGLGTANPPPPPDIQTGDSPSLPPLVQSAPLPEPAPLTPPQEAPPLPSWEGTVVDIRV